MWCVPAFTGVPFSVRSWASKVSPGMVGRKGVAQRTNSAAGRGQDKRSDRPTRRIDLVFDGSLESQRAHRGGRAAQHHQEHQHASKVLPVPSSGAGFLSAVAAADRSERTSSGTSLRVRPIIVHPTLGTWQRETWRQRLSAGAFVCPALSWCRASTRPAPVQPTAQSCTVRSGALLPNSFRSAS